MLPSLHRVTRVGRLLTSVLLLLTGLLAPVARANTLSPEHPIWRHPGVDQQSFLRHWEDGLASARKRAPVSQVGHAKSLTSTGVRVLVIPALFADSGEPPVSQDQLQDRFFGSSASSVTSYWSEVSGGAFVPEGRVTPWLRLPETITTYRNVLDAIYRGDAGPRLFVRDAMRAAAEVVLDLSQFDDDGPDGIPGSGDDDGRVDLLLVLHPDMGFEIDPSPTGPAMLSLQSTVEPDDELWEAAGVFADAFVVASAQGPLGVWVHEMGHLLGLEDLYDLSGAALPEGPSAAGGLGLWSLMASGTWGGDGSQPSHLDAVSRSLLGWGTRVVVEDAASLSLEPVSAAIDRRIEFWPLGEWGRERFVIEHRRRRTEGVVDAALPGSGVLVYRVDESKREILGPGDSWIELMQADGRDDLGLLVNTGDATDVYTGEPGANRLGPATTPSSESTSPDPLRVPPVVQIEAFADGSPAPLVLHLGEGGELRLQSAWFDDPLRGPRTHLLPMEEAGLNLRFASVGETDVVSASVDVVALGDRLELTTPGPFSLEENGGVWETGTPLPLRDLENASESTFLRLSLTVDGEAPRILELGVPVGVGPGLSTTSLFDFEPSVLAALNDTTRFEPLEISELPLPVDAGWGLRTNGAERYADGVDVVLTGPWFALPSAARIELWSKARTETSLPGQVFDAGILENYRPDRGWRALEPDRGDVVHVVQRSRATVRNSTGFGGSSGEWLRSGAELPTDLLAQRVRLRFASDQSLNDEGWSVAGLATEVQPASATVEVEIDRDGEVQATSRLEGDVSDLLTLRYRYRRLDESTWEVASGLLGVTSGAATRTRLDVPSDAKRLRIALFAEIGSGANTPRLKLGEAGLRRTTTLILPSLLQNPVHAKAIFQLTPQDESLALRIFDLRGRRVADLSVPPGVTWFEWGGEDAEGTRVAAGRYFLARVDDLERVLPFTYFP